MNRYYPYLIKGELNWERQKRFFHCFRGALDLIVNKKIFIHDSSRDYFTREEIFKLFHFYFEYSVEKSHRLAGQLLAVKRMLIGGSVDRLKDKELSAFYNLIYDYRDAYFVIHKQIPVFIRAFTDSSYIISPEQKNKSLSQLKKSFKLLESAYKRENITYPIQDIYLFGHYFKQAGLLEDERKADRSFSFFHHLIGGLVYPHKPEIKKDQWDLFFNAFYKTAELFLYYKTYFVEGLSGLKSSYARLESARLFLSLLDSGSAGSFPLKNLDDLLSVLVSFFEEQTEGDTIQNIFSSLKNKEVVRLFTRTLVCFSLKKAGSKADCSSEWKKDSSVVTVSFPDSQFQIFPDRIQARPSGSSKMFLSADIQAKLNQWIHDYKTDLFHLHQGAVNDTALRYQLDHWLDSFFSWDEGGRVKFGAFYPSDNKNKVYEMLNYKSFLSLFFSSYLPESYFSHEEKEISFDIWKDMVSQVSPLLVMLSGNQGYKPSWKKSFYDLFYIADSFLNSADKNERLSSRELIDLTVHLLSAVQNSQQAFDRVSDFCGSNLNRSCIASAVLKEPDILSVYPRFQKYIFSFKEPVYKEKILEVLGEFEPSAFTSFKLAPLFFLIQSMELNYHIIDQDQSFNLESDELLLYSKRFTDDIMKQVPFVFNSNQALSYLMYSFKAGIIPFFTGSDFDTVHYTHWHLSSKRKQDFTITPNDFHLLVFDFYNLYKRF